MKTLTRKHFSSRLRVSRVVLLPIAVALFAMYPAPAAKAATLYTYTGNNYTACGGTYCNGGPYSLSVSFLTTLDGNALVNLPFTDITTTITAFKFSDGSGLSFNNTNSVPGQLEIQISTNTSGNIVTWFVGADTLPADTQMQTNWNSPFGFIPGADFSETTPNFAGDYGFIFNDPGTWVMQVTTPEPSTVVLLATGLLVLGMFRARWPDHS